MEDEALVALKSVVLAKESKMRNLLTLKKLCMKSIIGSFNIDPSSPLILGISDIFSLLRKCFLIFVSQFLMGVSTLFIKS